MSEALKKPPELPEEEEEILNEELAFDVDNDWRSVKDATSTNIFKDEDMEITEDEGNIDDLSLDLKKEFVKESAVEHARAQAKKSRLRKLGKGDSETLKKLQEAAAGEGSGDEEELEILNEEDQALVNDPIFSNQGNSYPQIHGNYFLLDHLVDGGMAKVCRARYLGEGDEADKMVAIKMVQEKFSEDDDFVQMFIDEIKVSFGLNHPNINTTFDYGKIGKNLFVSMEYIHGKDLMVLIDKLSEQGKTLPVPVCIFIAAKMCEALHYAHNFTNQLTGQKYNIVHRDISPHNAMVSYEGYVKVIDFGIAKADTNSQKEEEGTVKGKINYFAPEYLEGKKIDHRYDQFAIGLTLWEMLTGKKTFKAEGAQIETLKVILACQPEKASAYNNQISGPLDKAIMKALSRDPKDRFKDTLWLNKELMKILYSEYPDFHESEIAELMKDLFEESYEKDLEKFKEFGQYSISDIVGKIKAYKEFQKRQSEKVAAGQGKSEAQVFDFGFSEEAITARSSKNGLDSIMSKKKKGNGKSGAEKERRRQQKALAMMLADEEDEGTGKPDLPVFKIIALGLFVLGFSQRSLILDSFNSIFEAKPIQVAEPVNTPVPQKKNRKPVAKKVAPKKQVAKRVVAKQPKKTIQKPKEKKLLSPQELRAQLEAAIQKRKVQPTRNEIIKQNAKSNINFNPANIDTGKLIGKDGTPETDIGGVITKGADGNKGISEFDEKGNPIQIISDNDRVEGKAVGDTGVEQDEAEQVIAEEEKPDFTKMSSTEIELWKLKQEMKELLREQKIAEGVLNGDTAPEADGESINDLAEQDERIEEQTEEIGRDLASKLKKLEEEEAAAIEAEEAQKENPMWKFIKTRKAFSWMFGE